MEPLIGFDTPAGILSFSLYTFLMFFGTYVLVGQLSKDSK